MIRFVERETAKERDLLRTMAHLKMPREELLQLTLKLIFSHLKRRNIIIIIIKQ